MRRGRPPPHEDAPRPQLLPRRRTDRPVFRAVSFRAAAASRVGLGTALATLGHVAERSLAVRLPGPVPGAQNVSVTDVPLDGAIPEGAWLSAATPSHSYLEQPHEPG